MNWGSDTSLIFANACLLWAITNYCIDDSDMTPRRRTVLLAVPTVIGSALLCAIADWPKSAILAGLFLLGTVLLPFSRRDRVRKYWAEIEIGFNALFILTAASIIWGLHPGYRGLIRIPMSSEKIAAGTMIAAVAIAMMHGGNRIVRGVLEKAGALPKTGNKTDAQEVSRGRLIGIIERVVLALAVAAGSYEALGFLVAAKGLIRAKEFDDRAFAEYFIIGSLLSVLIAFFAGLLIRYFLGVMGIVIMSAK